MGALVSGAILLPAAPALADVNVSPNSMEMKAGDNRDITIGLSGQDALDAEVTVKVPNELIGELTLRENSDDCEGNNTGVVSCTNLRGTRLQIGVVAKNPSGLEPNSTKTGQVSVQVNDAKDNVEVRLRGPEQAQVQSVTEVNGKVVDTTTADAVPNAQITVKDSAGNEHNATANAKGEYKVAPQNNKPIVPGALQVTAVREGYAEQSANATGVAGRAVTVQIRMKPSASTPPSAPAAAEPAATDAASPGASDVAAPDNTSGDEGGTSMLSYLLIGMGVLLVLLGIGAIVLLVMRRKGDDADGDDYDDAPGPNRMAPVGAAAGGYRGGADPTMVGGRPGMNDATAIVGPQQLDEFPDPYSTGPGYGGGTGPGYSGAPAGPGGPGGQATSPAGPGYARSGGYGDDPGYGGAHGSGADNGYGPRGGGAGYGDDPRGGADNGYGARTNGYGPNGAADNGYGAGTHGGAPGGAHGAHGGGGDNGYGAGANGYGGAHGSGAGNGYGGGANGYDDAPRAGRYADEQPTGRYPASGAGAGGGYPSAGGYPGGANGAGGGYDNGQPPRGEGGRQGGGLDRQGGEYERGGGDPRAGGRNRSVDWLD